MLTRELRRWGILPPYRFAGRVETASRAVSVFVERAAQRRVAGCQPLPYECPIVTFNLYNQAAVKLGDGIQMARPAECWPSVLPSLLRHDQRRGMLLHRRSWPHDRGRPADQLVLFIDAQNSYKGAREHFFSRNDPSPSGFEVDTVEAGFRRRRKSRGARQCRLPCALVGVRVDTVLPDSSRDPKGYAAHVRQCAKWRRERCSVDLASTAMPTSTAIV